MISLILYIAGIILGLIALYVVVLFVCVIVGAFFGGIADMANGSSSSSNRKSKEEIDAYFKDIPWDMQPQNCDWS